jgi:hypothetical protein
MPNNPTVAAWLCPLLLVWVALGSCGGLVLTSAAQAAPLNWRPYRAPAIVPVTAEELADHDTDESFDEHFDEPTATTTQPASRQSDEHAGDRFPTERDHDDLFPPQMTRPKLLPQSPATQPAAKTRVGASASKATPSAQPQPTPAASRQPRSAVTRVKRASASQPTKTRDRILQVAALQTEDGNLFDPFADEPANDKQKLDEELKGLELDSDAETAPTDRTNTRRANEVDPEPTLDPLPEPTEDAFPAPSRPAEPADEGPLPTLDGTSPSNSDIEGPTLDDEDYYRPRTQRNDEDFRREADCTEDKADCADAYARLKNNTLANIDLSINVSGVEGLDYPCECPFAVGETFEGRNWPKITYNWKASGLCHKPLYFEQVAVERYGHSALPVLQDIISGAHFFASVAVLPYSMGLCPPDECQYSLGYYRPGNCAPYLIDPIPLSMRAGLFQATAIVGGILIIP